MSVLSLRSVFIGILATLTFSAMGYGWFGAHGPPRTRLFLSSLVTHVFYGAGLWLGASILSPT